MGKLTRGIPVLASLEIFKAADYCREKLGFDREGRKNLDRNVREFALLGRVGNTIKFGQNLER